MSPHTAGVDYDSTIPSVVFPGGSNQGATQPVSVAILDSPCVEEDEDFTALLGTVDPSARVDPNADTATITIVDDSRMFVLLS